MEKEDKRNTLKSKQLDPKFGEAADEKSNESETSMSSSTNRKQATRITVSKILNVVGETKMVILRMKAM